MNMKKTLNEEVSRIKGMMGLNESQKQNTNEWFGGIAGRGFDDPMISGDIDWEDPSDARLEKAHASGAKEIEVYGQGPMVPYEGATRYRGVADIIFDGSLFADLDNVRDVEEDTDWEPSDDQMANYGNTEGGIGYSNPPAWNGR